MAVVNVDYNEGAENGELGYKSIILSNTDNNADEKFNTGDFVQDWFNLTKYVMMNELQYVGMSSSVDHFIMDGGHELYDSMYLVFDIDKNKWELSNDFTEEGYEFFVPKGHKFTWEKMKEIYND